MSQKKTVYQYSCDGDYIATHDSVYTAAENVGRKDDAPLISRACRKGYIHKGFHWSYNPRKHYHHYHNDIETHSPQLPAVLILDIETSLCEGYMWGCGKQYIPISAIKEDWFMLGFSSKWLFDPEVISEFVTPGEAIKKDDSRVCRKLWELMDKADVIIAHFGDEFDIKKSNSRFYINGLMRPSPFLSIDTVKASRKVFAHTSNKLDYLSWINSRKHKLKTDLSLWINCMNGNAESLAYMQKYCDIDMLLLEEYYISIRGWIPNHPNYNLIIEPDGKLRCGVCLEADRFKFSGHYKTPVNRYRTLRCLNCTAQFRLRKSEITKEQKDLIMASVAR